MATQGRRRKQSLQNIFRLMDERSITPADQLVDFGPEALDPRFAYQGNPGRDPFQPVMGAPSPTLARPGRQDIPPWVLQAAAELQAKRRMGFKSDGDLAREAFLARGGARRSPLWG